ncbi:MAG: single-stranded DNA-binding protein [Chloroflexota bacterium]|nr:single-stranded DNA-binding protein [Chloroflexota bacterium]
MAALNKVMIIGNVGRDPEMRYTPDGKANAKFSVAVSRVWTNPEGEKKEETEWFTVVAWDKLAETCGNYITKGQKVYVEGRLQTRTWEGQDGLKHKTSDLVARDVIFLSPRAKTATPEDDLATASSGGAEIEPNDIPF